MVHPVSCGPSNIVAGSKGGLKGKYAGPSHTVKGVGHWIEGIGTVVRLDQQS